MWRTVIFLIVIIGLALRVASGLGELWLDEIWSIVLIAKALSPLDILLTVRHDNNHLLNSLWIWVLPNGSSPLLYRTLSLVCSVVLLCALARRVLGRQDPTLLVWLTLLSCSYVAVLYGSEARGYSSALCCAILAFFSLEDITTSRSVRSVIPLTALILIGCLSHATFILFLCPALAWLVWLQVRGGAHALTFRVLRPIVFSSLAVVAFLMLTFYSRLAIGGAPRLPYIQVALTFLSISFGGSFLSQHNIVEASWMVFSIIAILVALIAELWLWLRTKDSIAVLILLILLTPIAAVVCVQPAFILGRYFLIPIAFLYLLVARFFVRLGKQGKIGMAVALTCFVGFVVANLRTTWTLISGGRAQYLAAFHDMRTTLSQGEIRFGGNQDFQNSIRLGYLLLTHPDLDYLRYESGYLNATPSPDFLIFESIDPFDKRPTSLTNTSNRTYSFFRYYQAPPESGSQWYVYQRDSNP